MILIALLLFTVVSIRTCESDETYIKISKKNGGSYALEEFIDIYDGNTVLYTIPPQANNDLFIVEQCLTSTTNNQYTIKLRDTYGDSWNPSSYIMVEGPYGNIVFKNLMTNGHEENYPLSLYMPIEKNDSWKMTSGSVTGDWTQYNFGDSGWTQVTLDSVQTQPTGTQYFRKQFVGLADMAAYEVSFNYRYGIIAYINGAEIYRDNMADGAATGSTVATGSYPSTQFHAIIRPGTEVANGQSVLAVEIHFMNSAIQNSVDFDAYLAIMARSVSEETDSCFIYPYTVFVTASRGSNVANVFDWNRISYYYTYTYPSYVTYNMDGPIPFINGFRIWPYTSPTNTPTGFNVQGTNSAGESSWTNVIVASSMFYTAQTYKSVFGYYNTGLFSYYRIQINTAFGTPSRLYEAQPLICSISTPTFIEFEEQTYVFHAKYESVLVKPKVADFTGCIISPSPSDGLTFDPATCTLSGITFNHGTTVYTVVSTLNGQQYTGSFSLQITGCAGSLINVNRVYSTNAVKEGFTILDSSKNVIVQVNPNSDQTNNKEMNYNICLTNTSNYEVTVSSTSSYW